MSWRSFLEMIGVIPPIDPHKDLVKKTDLLVSEHHQALYEVQKALERQKEAADRVHTIAKKQEEDADQALLFMRSMLKRASNGGSGT